MGLILNPHCLHYPVGSTLPGNTGQQRTDCLRAFTTASWLLLGPNHCTHTVGCCCGKRHQQKFLCSIECLKQPSSGWQIHATLMRLPSVAKLILSVTQSNSALHYKYYMGTISIPLVLEQQNPKVYWKSVWSLAMSRDFMQRCQCATSL